mgnify:FL=1
MARLKALIARVRREGFSPTEFHRICVAALFFLGAIIVTGALVRLTGSGLGCSNWPTCSDTKLVDISSKHAAIEQINRFFTFVVGLAVILAALAALVRKPRRKDLTWLSLALVAGVPAQGLVGALVVWTDLHPAAVQLHMLLSLVLIALAVVLVVRSREPDGGRRVLSVPRRVRSAVWTVVVLTGLAVVAGTVVTGTGPHAGDEKARRFGFALTTVTRIHAVVVWIALFAALRLLWMLRNKPRDREELRTPLTVFLVALVVQGAIGYIQYEAKLPIGLVLAHIAGATVVFGVAVWLLTATMRVSLSTTETIDEVIAAARRRRGKKLA